MAQKDSAVAAARASRDVSPYVLHANTPFRSIWDTSQIFILVYVALAVPYRMGFDADQVDAGGSPGVITTFDAEAEVPRMLDEATLRPIDPIAFDALADMEMGDGRERNLIYAASPSTPASEALLVIISLRTDDVVEVRLIRPGHVEEEVTPERRPIYGLFQLTRRQGDCGF